MLWNPRVAQLKRRSIRLRGYDYTRPGAYFVTICVIPGGRAMSKIADRRVRLTEIGGLIRDCWRAIPKHFAHARLDAFVIMPDHILGIVVLTKTQANGAAIGRIRPGSLGAIVRSFKSAAAAQVNRLTCTPRQRVWQRNYYERVVRSEAELHRIRWYIITNPIRWNRRNRPHTRGRNA